MQNDNTEELIMIKYLKWLILVKISVSNFGLSQRNDQTGIPALQIDGKVVDDDCSKAESFNYQFYQGRWQPNCQMVTQILILLWYLLKE